MIRTNLQRLVPSHNQPRLRIFPMLQQPHVPRPAFLPISILAIEFEQLGAHLEDLFLALLVRFCLDFLGQMHNGLEMDFW